MNYEPPGSSATAALGLSPEGGGLPLSWGAEAGVFGEAQGLGAHLLGVGGLSGGQGG